MFKFILGLVISTQILANEEVGYANLYADQLLNEFDSILDQKILLDDKKNILETETYARLLSARAFIEEKDSLRKVTYYWPMIRNSELYGKVVSEINQNAVVIKEKISRIKKNNPVIYPSIKSEGNLTGNTFPTKIWSLTFDDGPHPSRTEKIVNELYLRNTKATFFMLTANAKKMEDVASYVVNSGMELALHSYDHPDLNKASDEKLEYQITTAKKDLEELLNKEITLFRLPYGSGLRNSKVRNQIANSHLIHVFWNVDTLDWKDKDPDSIVERSLKQMKLSPKNSGIVLFHDIHNQSVIASIKLLDKMMEMGIKNCTVQEVVNYFNKVEQSCLE